MKVHTVPFASMYPVVSFIYNYQINSKLLKLANPDCILMHPGPVNKGIELSQNAYDSENSVINDQVRNGVAVRMAILTKHFSM